MSAEIEKVHNYRLNKGEEGSKCLEQKSLNIPQNVFTKLWSKEDLKSEKVTYNDGSSGSRDYCAPNDGKN